MNRCKNEWSTLFDKGTFTNPPVSGFQGKSCECNGVRKPGIHVYASLIAMIWPWPLRKCLTPVQRNKRIRKIMTWHSRPSLVYNFFCNLKIFFLLIDNSNLVNPHIFNQYRIRTEISKTRMFSLATYCHNHTTSGFSIMFATRLSTDITFFISIQFVVCKSFQFGQGWNFVVC